MSITENWRIKKCTIFFE